jgi:disulfide bond formation protein DsbB
MQGVINKTFLKRQLIMLKLLRFNPRIWFFLGFLGCVFYWRWALIFNLLTDWIHALVHFPAHCHFTDRSGFLSAAIHNPGQAGVKAYAIAGAVTALCGAAISTRHVWIQHMPADKVPECGPGLEYVLQNFPLFETVKLMLSGTGDCAKVDWTLLGFSMPAWTLLAFFNAGDAKSFANLES